MNENAARAIVGVAEWAGIVAIVACIAWCSVRETESQHARDAQRRAATQPAQAEAVK